MSHTDLWIARHGEVAARWRDRLYGDLDVPLSPVGQRQSEELARRFDGVELSGVVSSGLERAEFAAALLRAPRGLTRRDEADLREIRRGEWAGLARSEIAARDPELWREHLRHAGANGAPGGETPDGLAARVIPALDRLAREFSSRTVAVVAHRWVVAVAVCRAVGLPVERAAAFELPHAALVHLRWPEAGLAGGGAPELVAFGHAGPVAAGS